MKTILLLLLPIFVTAQHALKNRNEFLPSVPVPFPLCQSCCNVNTTDPYKAVIQNYNNLDSLSGTPKDVPLPAENYYLLWENDGSQLDTLWGNQAEGHIFRKKDAAGNWYFPKWLVNRESREIATSSGNQQAYGTQNVKTANGEMQILLTQNDKGELSSACLYGNGKNKYGYWEARIKVTDASKGTFPTFWLFSSACESNYVEIDICDFALKNNQRYGISSWESATSGKCECYSVYGSQIRPTMRKGNFYKNIDFSADYFIYGVDWRPDSVIYYLNRDRILATPNIAHNAPVRTIFELKVKESWKLDISPNAAHIYAIDWVKYYKRKEDMDLMLAAIPAQACIGKDINIVMSDFVEGAYFTCEGVGNIYTSPKALASDEIPNNLPSNIPAIYPHFYFREGHVSWDIYAVLHVPQTCITGTYLITLHIPNVPEKYCPKKEIQIISAVPDMPTTIFSEMKGSDAPTYKCILTTNVINNATNYAWKIDSLIEIPSFILKNAGTYKVSVSAINSCGASLPYQQVINCTQPDCNNCNTQPFAFSPNPTHSNKFLMESLVPISRIILYDLNGQKVFEQEKKEALTWEIDVPYLAQGIYLVALYGEKQVFYGKIIISM